MELNEEQKKRAQKIADEVDDNPAKYFSSALRAAFKKGNNEIESLMRNFASKLRIDERYSQAGKLAEKAMVEIQVIRVAFRIWYEEGGKDLVAEEKNRLETLFNKKVAMFEALLVEFKRHANEIAKIFKRK